MKESTLLKIALIGALVGLVLLYFVSEKADYGGNLDNAELGDTVKVIGVVNSVRNSGNTTFLSITKEEYVDIVVFKALNLTEGQYIEVIGEVDEYEGEREMIGNALRVIS